MQTRIVPTKAHGIFDLVTGPALVAAPNLLRLNGARGSTLPPRLTGLFGTGLSALTDYETGAVRLVPMKAHLAFDGVSGAAVGAEGYGIHGTIEPDSIGKNASHGCIRLRNGDVDLVWEALVPNKSTVVIVD